MPNSLKLIAAEGARGGRHDYGQPVRHHCAREWREFTVYSAPCVVVTIAQPPGIGRAASAYGLGVEWRRTAMADPRNLRCFACADVRELLAHVAHIARDLATGPAPSLRIETDDNLGSGVTVRAVLLLLASVQRQNDDQGANLAAGMQVRS